MDHPHPSSGGLMTIQIYPDLEALGRAAAELFASRARDAVQTHGRFVVALAGGNTPKGAYELLNGPPFHEQVPWEKVHVFFGDERCVPPNDPRSNQRMARRALLDRVPLPPGQVHPIPCDAPPGKAAEQYETLLRDFFTGASPRFDLVFLGMGEDGHTASLFPGATALEERDRWTTWVCPPAQELCRVTLTTPIINQTAVAAFLVSGEGKAPTLRDVLEGPNDPRKLPAQLIQPSDGELIWLVDESAASQLRIS